MIPVPSPGLRGLIALAWVALAACESPQRGMQQVSEEDSAGVRLFVNRAPAPEVPRNTWRLEPVVDIGGGGGEEYELFRVSDAVLMPDGSIVVANGGGPDVRFFDADGRHVRTAGREGDGPGEFRSISGIVRAGRDSLLVFDPALARLSILDGSGELLGTTGLNPTGDARRPLRLYRLAGTGSDGQFVLVAYGFPADMSEVPTLHWDSVATLMYERSGDLVGTVGEFAGMDMYATPTRAGDIFFARASSADVRADRLYMTDGGDYEIRVYEPGSGLDRIVRWERERRPITDADRAWLSETYLGRAPNEEMRPMLQSRLDEWVWADAKPWVSSVVVDSRERLWVEEYQHPWRSAPRTWTVFDPRGAVVGSASTPAGFRIFEVEGDRVLGLWRDELEVEHVQVHRIVEEEGPGG